MEIIRTEVPQSTSPWMEGETAQLCADEDRALRGWADMDFQVQLSQCGPPGFFPLFYGTSLIVGNCSGA